MLNVLLVVQIVLSVLLVTIILLQRTNSDGVSGLASGNNMGVVSARAKANFLTRTTMILAFCFMANAIILANLSSKERVTISDKILTLETENKDIIEEEKSELEIAE